MEGDCNVYAHSSLWMRPTGEWSINAKMVYWMGVLRSLVPSKIIDRPYKRWIKEAVAIRKKKGTTVNRDEGQYFLSHTFDEFLMKTKQPIGKSTGNTENVARRQSTSVSSQWWLRQHWCCQNVHVLLGSEFEKLLFTICWPILPCF